MIRSALTILLTVGLFSGVALGAAPDPESLLKRADNIRNPAESFLMKASIRSSDADTPSLFEVYTGGKDKTLVKTLEPARDRGRNMVMIGDDMWAYIPNLKRAVRVSLNQKLTGQAANGDISRMRWYGDYQAKLESENGKVWVLLLSAQRKGLTYDKVRAWIAKDTGRPLQAEYLTQAGKPLKKVTFGDYREDAGAIRPHTIRIVDVNNEKSWSVVEISALQVKSFPDSIFHQNSLSE